MGNAEDAVVIFDLSLDHYYVLKCIIPPNGKLGTTNE